MKANELFLLSYLPSLDEVQEVFDNKSKQIERYAYILHDKDTYEKDIIDRDTGEILHREGEAKLPHIHIYLKLNNSREIDEVKRWFVRKDENGNNINCLREIVRNRVSVIKYLIHDTKTSKNKYPYSPDEVHAYNIEDIDEDEPADETYQIILDMINGADRLSMLKRYGRAFIYHYNSFKQFYDDILIAERREQKKDEVILKMVYNEPLPFDVEQLSFLKNEENKSK